MLYQRHVMNIVRVLGSKKFLSTLFGIALCIVGIQFSLTPRHIVVCCDKRWTSNYHKELTKYIERLPIRTIGAWHLRSDLQKDYPCIKDCTITYTSRLEAQVTLTGWRPLVMVRSLQLGNKTYVICEKGHVLEATNFTAEALQGMPTLTLAGGDFEVARRTPELIDMALKLPPDLFQTFTITWHSKTHITLVNIEKNIVVTSDIASIHDHDRYAYIDRIYTQEKNYKKGMKADIRLKDSIVCAPLR